MLYKKLSSHNRQFDLSCSLIPSSSVSKHIQRSFSATNKKTSSTTNVEYFLSDSAKLRKPSPIRALLPLIKRTPGLISLGGGLPASGLFPISNLTFTVSTGSVITLEASLLAEALQYSDSYGLSELVSQLKRLQRRTHKPQYHDWKIMVTTGSQDGLTKAFSMLLNKGDTILTENPTYSGALAALHPMGVKLIGLNIDNEGIEPSLLRDLLNNFSSKFPHHKKPKVLYTIPTGQNPSGVSTSNARRKEIYKIACEHNLLILEDDPYWFLCLLPAHNQTVEQLQSYFSMDTQQRVIRFDSFSKVVSSGLRIGWVTGPSNFVENLQLDQQCSSLHASGISQAIVLCILKNWGTSGFDEHVQRVQLFYSTQRDAFLSSASKHLSGLCEWHPPNAGMFGWIKVNNITDTSLLIEQEAVKAGVLMLPGRVFSPNNEPSPYVRASYSIATPQQMDDALYRFSQLLKTKKTSLNLYL